MEWYKDYLFDSDGRRVGVVSTAETPMFFAKIYLDDFLFTRVIGIYRDKKSAMAAVEREIIDSTKAIKVPSEQYRWNNIAGGSAGAREGYSASGGIGERNSQRTDN